MNLSRKIPNNIRTDKKREVPLEHDYLDSIQYHYVLNIPEGYTVDYLPEGIKLTNPHVDCTIAYELTGTQIIYKHDFKLKSLVFDTDAQKIVNAFIEKVERQYQEVVVLKKI